MKNILIVEDDTNIRELIKKCMEREGYACAEAETGDGGVRLAHAARPDLVLLDLMLPGMDGLSVLRALRMEGLRMPVIILTAKSDEADKVIGLGLGADDYITKPFGLRELAARVEAVLRRTAEARPVWDPPRTENAGMAAPEGGGAPVMPSGIGISAPSGAADPSITVGGIEIDAARYEARLRGVPVPLTLKEFELLRALAENRGQVLTRAQLLDSVWGYDYAGETRTVDVHVRCLRKKLGAESILTVRGVGYRFGL